MSATISIAIEVTDELVQAFAQLVPQLSAANPPPTREQLQTIVSSEASTIFIARVDGNIVGSLTLAVFSIPTATRAGGEDVVVAASARRRGVGAAPQRLHAGAVELNRFSVVRQDALESICRHQLQVADAIIRRLSCDTPRVHL